MPTILVLIQPLEILYGLQPENVTVACFLSGEVFIFFPSAV